ncbi:hypothetical protein FKR81_18880 [Lentzea tibetensis]|uniref:Bacterial transcriptional activator domain-containing protein n=1 Tax=Lentzea tibetensis TaxID=2591470 RepID=A0A563ESJ8_9PSEU|nr:BTAD domain-containing putative transcriptional regulator [Lentzea tibetensis]TWP50677.1 hypothetical protein FKR81_18880 [Lentzea tibetensis]
MTGPLRGRFAVVVAAAGYGKSTAVRQWADHTWTVVEEFADLRPAEKLVVVSRTPPALANMLKLGLGAPTEIGPRHLALSAREVDSVLWTEYGVRNSEVHELTAGWPALVHLAAAALSTGQPLGTPGTPLFDYIATEVLDALPPGAENLLAVDIGPITAELAAAVGHEEATTLARLGLLVGGPEWYLPVPLVATVARARAKVSPARQKVMIALAAEWHAENGQRLLADGAAEHVLRFVRTLPPGRRGYDVELLYADAQQATGETARALMIYSSLADGLGSLPADLAWRYGAAVYLWGNPHDALGILSRGELTGERDTDQAMLLAWTAAAHWLAGADERCADFAGRAMAAASDDRTLAAAHVALALSAHLRGDPMALQANYSTALGLATSAGDLPMVLRIRINLAAALEQEGKLTDALAVLAPAVELAGRRGYVSSLALALANEGALHQQLGALDDAVRAYESAVAAYQRMHSLKAAYPLTGLGDVYRLRGMLTQSRAAYAEALRAATEDGNNRQGLVPALAGMARATDDPVEAASLAERAVEHASGHWRATALVARGWVALRAGKDAAQDAREAADVAARHRDRAGLAHALELRAAVSGERQPLAEALAIWEGCGAVLDADRVRVAIGRLPRASVEQRLLGRLAEHRLRAADVAVQEVAPPVAVRVLGGFDVLVDGVPVPPTAWQSRKARDLLRVLVARRGSPVPREELADLLWGPVSPADEAKIAHRLSVALSTLRGVLDPERREPIDHYVTATPAHVALAPENIVVDVEDWLVQARHALRTREPEVLAATDRAYTGEVFADDPYAATALRDEAHATYLHVVRALVEHFRREDDIDYVICYLLRVLAVEPSDEQAHWDLVTTLADAGRHGEAARAHVKYAAAMAELGVPARPLPKRG